MDPRHISLIGGFVFEAIRLINNSRLSQEPITDEQVRGSLKNLQQIQEEWANRPRPQD